MDVKSFNSKSNYWQKMNREYEQKLIKMKNDNKYEIFFNLIDEMLKNNSKLEQEAFI